MKKISLLIFTFSILVSCSSTADDINSQNEGGTISISEDWLLPRHEIKDGGPGRDGIPSIENPEFIVDPGAAFGGLADDELVIGIFFEGEARAYPHKIMDWHEIVNHDIGNDPIALSYCPLTGTAFAWSRIVGGSKTTFGTSGLLYNSNILMYDRESDSFWSQLKLQCVNGELVGERPTTYDVVETDWKTWKQLYPETLVLSENTGFSRNYGDYPYGQFKTNHDYFFYLPAPHDKRLPSKKRVYAVLDEEVAKVYKYEDFTGGKAIVDTFNDKKYLIVGNEDIINSFVLSEDNQQLTFQYKLGPSGSFFIDNLGTERNVFGHPNAENNGEYFTAANSVVSYWFAIGAFYPGAEIYVP